MYHETEQLSGLIFFSWKEDMLGKSLYNESLSIDNLSSSYLRPWKTPKYYSSYFSILEGRLYSSLQV